MKRVAIMIADSCEEVEALTVVDMLRRAKMNIDMVSISNCLEVTGSHQITFQANRKIAEMDVEAYDAVILPGGMPGTIHLKEDKKVLQMVADFYQKKKLVAAICAAPTVLAAAGILADKKATCYPGMEEGLVNAQVIYEQEVVRDGNIITSQGLGTAIPFSLAIISYLSGEESAKAVGEAIVYKK